MKRHEWINSRGKRLSAMVHQRGDRPAGNPVVVFCHGFTGDKVGANQLMLNLAKGLEAAGLAAVRFDFAGSGDSEGEFAADTTVTGWQEDLANVIAWAKSRAEFAGCPLVVLGHSLGGLIALTNADTAVSARVVLAPVMEPVANFRDIILGPQLWQQAVEGKTIANFYNKGFAIKPGFVRGLLAAGYSPLAAARGYTAPLLIIHGDSDVAVPIAGSEELYREYRGEKEFQKIAADHVFIGKHQEVADRVATWLLRVFPGC